MFLDPPPLRNSSMDDLVRNAYDLRMRDQEMIVKFKNVIYIFEFRLVNFPTLTC